MKPKRSIVPKKLCTSDALGTALQDFLSKVIAKMWEETPEGHHPVYRKCALDKANKTLTVWFDTRPNKKGKV